jgi:hypothetical protein
MVFLWRDALDYSRARHALKRELQLGAMATQVGIQTSGCLGERALENHCMALLLFLFALTSDGN